MGWWLKEVKQLHLDSLMGFLSKLEPSLSLGSYLCWKSGHSQAAAGRKRRMVSDLTRVCSGCRTAAVEEVGWLQGHWTWQESVFSSLHCWRSGVTLQPLEQSWGILQGGHGSVARCPLSCGASSPPEPAHPLLQPRSASQKHKNVHLAEEYLSPFACSQPGKEASYLLSSSSRALPQHFIKCTGLSCCATMSVLLKEMFKQQRGVSLFLCWLVLLFFPPEVQVVCIWVNKETSICVSLPVTFKLCVSLYWEVPVTLFVP